ncbi:MAG TPA: GntR family transcriptional regulator [Candidatus Olsenella avistercoris]|nr:GntR family transcriptional regulator [Candidatus Olsenella avistercoris]
MVITVDKLSETPLYLQLRAQVIAGIAAGELRPGDPLPSVRALAEDLGINLHTVNKAYATLRDEGYVIMLGRRGAYVADAPADPAAGMDEAALDEELGRLAVEFKASGGTRAAFVEAALRAASDLPEGA